MYVYIYISRNTRVALLNTTDRHYRSDSNEERSKVLNEHSHSTPRQSDRVTKYIGVLEYRIKKSLMGLWPTELKFI